MIFYIRFREKSLSIDIEVLHSFERLNNVDTWYYVEGVGNIEGLEVI